MAFPFKELMQIIKCRRKQKIKKFCLKERNHALAEFRAATNQDVSPIRREEIRKRYANTTVIFVGAQKTKFHKKPDIMRYEV